MALNTDNLSVPLVLTLYTQVDADGMDSLSTVMDLSGGTFYLDFEEVIYTRRLPARSFIVRVRTLLDPAQRLSPHRRILNVFPLKF